MFSLFHFSKVFPFIHPVLFPLEARAERSAAPEALPEVPCAVLDPAEAAVCHPVHPKRLKSLYRRHHLNQRHHAVTHSGLPA